MSAHRGLRPVVVVDGQTIVQERRSPEVAHGVTFLLVRSGHVLLERCPKKREALGVGEWFVPGGKVEPYERAEDAFARELHEELGLVPRAWRALPLVEGSAVAAGRQHGIFLMRPFLVTRWKPGVPDCTLDGQVPLRWVDFAHALRSPVPQVRMMVAAVLDHVDDE